jgi:hypothetical protein
LGPGRVSICSSTAAGRTGARSRSISLATEPKSAKPAGRLKVYRATLGFRESVVAAPNQAAALKAWGVRQNLFAEGAASVADDAGAVKAALAQPDVPLSRPVGSKAAFTAGQEGAPQPPAGRRKSAKPAPDRAALDAARAALAKVETESQAAATAFRDRQAALKAEAAASEKAWAERRARAKATVDDARRAYVRAGGKAGNG